MVGLKNIILYFVTCGKPFDSITFNLQLTKLYNAGLPLIIFTIVIYVAQPVPSHAPANIPSALFEIFHKGHVWGRSYF